MRHVFITILRLLGGFSLCLLGMASAFAQKPEIKIIDKVKGSMEQVVTLKGNGFGTDATKLSVTFGATKAAIQSITDQILEVKIPPGTTYDNISVSRRNGTTGLTAYTRDQFLLSFHGNPGFDPANLQGQFNFPSTPAVKEGLYDLCMCDFDGDGKTDVATATDNIGSINVYRNTSTGPGVVAYGGKFSINIFSTTLQIKCGDLNGDGKPDLVATESGTNDKVYILQNGSSGPGSILFSSQSKTLTGKRPKRIEIADLDLDGLPEIILSTQGSNSVTILQNQSTLASVIMGATPTQINIAGIASTDGLAVEDLNGDLLPEIVTSQFQTNTDVYVLENKSTPGSFNLTHTATITAGSSVKNIRIGDLDGDGKADLAFTQLTPSPALNIALNNSTTTSLSFGALKSIATEEAPWGLDFGDLDGDGKTDIVVCSIKSKALTILNNISTPGNANFQKFLKSGLDYITRHVTIGDVDTDGKPDIVFTSIDDNSGVPIPASKVSVFRNKACMVPEVTPAGPLNVCTSNPVELLATKGGGVTYEWTDFTTPTVGTNVFTPPVSGNYQVKAISESGSCTPVSNTVNITISSGIASDPNPGNNGPVCLGSSINIFCASPIAGYTYEWTGPEGYTASGTSLSIPNTQLIHAGTYYVDIKTPSGCISNRDSTVVQVVDIPDFKVSFTAPDVTCDIKQLTVFPDSPDFNYEWFKNSGVPTGVPGSHTLIVGGGPTGSGNYYFTATPTLGTCGGAQSNTVKITVALEPTVAFAIPSTACKGQEITFTNQSTTDGQTEAFYTWAFGDSETSEEKEPKHIYTSTGGRIVKLTVSYKNDACAKSDTKTITITDAPLIAITNPDNKFDLCPDTNLVLEATASFNSYVWNTGETSRTITVTEPGEYSVEVVSSNGCELKATHLVGEFPAPAVSVSVTPELVDEGHSAQLSASGLQTYQWEPAETLNDPAIANPVATPLTSTVYTVIGKDNNECTGTATIEVKVRGEAIVTKLDPGNFFSPNNDGVNSYWIVKKIDEYPQCGIVIYDDKGVKVYDAKPYFNDWDATFNGKKLPDGVYYYVIRCDGEENKPRMGSITILR